MTRALLITALVLATSPARADDGVLLGSLAAHECGLACSADEVAALAAVARARCPRCSLRTALRLVSPRFFAGRTRRSWLLWLRRDGSRPWSWPTEAASWSRHREAWLALLGRADAVVSGEVTHRCERTPEAWGGEMDRARAERLRLVEVDCGDTANRYYLYPARTR